MTTFKYKGLSPDGQKVSGVVKAYNEYEAVTQLRSTCSVITSIQEVKEAKGLNRDLGKVKIKDKDLAMICSQFSIILTSGLPIVRCVEMVAEQAADKQLRDILYQVAEDVSGGYSLATSFENHCPTLPVTFIETIRAGEESGTLELCFSRLYTYFDKSAKTKAKVASALTYPVMVIVVAIIVFIIVMVKAVPAFTTAFRDLGTDLPSITKGMIAVSDFMIEKWWAMTLIAMAIAAACILVKRDPRGRAMLDRRKLTKSPLKKIHSMNAASQFASTMATMISAGLPIVKALEVTAGVVTNGQVAEAIRTARQRVEQGKGLSEAMQESPYFPKLLTEMTGVGEQSGNMEQTLTVVSDYFTNEVSLATDRLLAVMEPAITIALAVVTVILLLGVYLPMFSLYGSIG